MLTHTGKHYDRHIPENWNHYPIDGRPDLVEKYKERLAQIGQQEIAPFILEGDPDAEVPLTREFQVRSGRNLSTLNRVFLV